MSGNYHRAQILLEPEQHRKLKQIAEHQGRSISDVAREIVTSGLKAIADEEEARSARWVDVERRLRVIRDAAQARKGVYQGSLVEEIRAERGREQGAALETGS